MKSRFGLIIFLLVFLVSAVTVARRVFAPTTDKRTVVRIAHWQLEAGVREAMAQVIKRYEAIHPEVHVIQMTIPDTMYQQWLQSQLAGGTCPEIIEYGFWYGRAADLQARYFTPLDSVLRKPNPYNQGTPLADVAWRDTFLDGLDNLDCYNAQMNQFFGVALCTASMRVFYNRDLLKRVTGKDEPPQDYRAFLRLCDEVKRYAAARNPNLIPVAAARDSVFRLVDYMLSAATMKSAYAADYLHRLRVDHVELGLAYLRGKWKYEQKDFMEGLEMGAQVAHELDPGALQMNRDGAMMKFASGDAVMFGSGSFDASSLKVLCDFPVGAFRIPVPAPDDPQFGDLIPGKMSDGRVTTGFSFYLLRGSPQSAQALDFLQYLTSEKGAQLFADQSGWLSGVVGVKPTEFSRQYYPEFDGYGTNGSFSLASGPDAFALFTKNLHYLVGPGGTPARFAAAMDEHLRRNIMNDVQRTTRDLIRNQNQQDVALAARRELEVIADDHSHDLALENSSGTLVEAKTYRFRRTQLAAEEKQP
ncbi:extracellular solute-binding protein [Horticoccus luteus]|uniref:Extracellular solute-binding protein n=1 Tax=Horticoccus luteus TaxID=2862869 RepID=A0A8F9TW38_9BACT|nr:extracellular solute-binding protein [Horticoccus luteus]QYM78647.1 extracellular solute-binding protein [Horticoccus luteus]